MRLKILLISFVLSFPLWWVVNVFAGNLENFWFYQELGKNPQLYTANIEQSFLEKKTEVVKKQPLEINARAAVSVFINQKGEKEILFKKNLQEPLAVASLTKLMTANVILSNFDLNQVIKVSDRAVMNKEDFGELEPGQVFRAGDLLYVLLIESSNDAAYALAETVGLEAFVDLMNLEADYLGMENTRFINPSGLDYNGRVNYSTLEDLVVLTEHLLENHALVWKILNYKEFDLYSLDGVYHHKLVNTNELLGELPGVIGGKTGQTPRSGGCLILVLKAPNNSGYIINGILDSEDRFREMEELISWIYGDLN